MSAHDHPFNIDPAELEIHPIERAETIPSAWYTDVRVHDIDRKFVFSRSWQYVGPASHVGDAGDYVTATIAGEPVVIIRGKDHVLRAFYNVCRHRGGPLATDERGSCTVLQCKYHGWTYLLDGNLRGVPKFDRVELFDKKDFGLIPVAIDVWEGMVFVNLDSAVATTPLQRTVDGIVERIAPVQLSDKLFHERVVYELDCNWKVYVDNYLEGYHLPLVHPELCNLLDYQQYVTETHERYSLQYSPITGDGNIYHKMNPQPGTTEEQSGNGSNPGIAYYYFIFPNFMLNILPGRLQTNLVVPVSYNRTKVLFDYYYDDVTTPHALRLINDDIAYSDRIQKEDMEICEHVQRGLESRAYDKGRFSVEMEQGVYHFQCMLKKAYTEYRK